MALKKMLSEILTEEAAKKAVEHFSAKITLEYPRRKLEEVKFLIDKGLPTYLRAQSYKCERIKTLISRNEPVLLKDCFVFPSFNIGRDVADLDGLFEILRKKSHAIIVSGPAGIGKSAFLKATFLECIERGETYYPIFFELRRVNGKKPSKDLLRNEMLSSIQESCGDFPKHLLDFGLKRGFFFFMLDGFDEVDHDIRDSISDELERLATNFQDCRFILTSRPSEDFAGWSSFDFVELRPFDLQQAIEYVKKLPYDEEEKDSFVSDLSEGLFAANSAFLSNPLLTAMMLVTYSAYGEIPTKRHVFYEKCFDVLTREHDSLKGRYKRVLFSGLSIEEIEQICKFICVFSYRKRKFRFSQSSLNEHIERAMNAASIYADTHCVCRDMQESISLLAKDGMDYEFIHRSFQEYFFAKFVVEDRRINLSDKIGWIVQNFSYDDTIDMILDMDAAYMEEKFILPLAEKFLKHIDGIDTSKNPAGVLSRVFEAVNYRERMPSDHEGSPEFGLSFTLRDDQSFFYVWRLARSKLYSSQYKEKTAEVEISAIAEKLRDEFGGTIKLHHRNNKKLLEIGLETLVNLQRENFREFVELLRKKRGARSDAMSAAFNAAYLN